MRHSTFYEVHVHTGPVNLISISQLPHFSCSVGSLAEAMLCGNCDNKSFCKSGMTVLTETWNRKENPSGAEESRIPSKLKEVQCI